MTVKAWPLQLMESCPSKANAAYLFSRKSMQISHLKHHDGHLRGLSNEIFKMKKAIIKKSRHGLKSSGKDGWEILECLTSLPLLFLLSNTRCAAKWNKTNNKTHFWFHTFCPAMHSFTLTTPNTLPPSTSQTRCISHNDSDQFERGWLFHRL